MVSTEQLPPVGTLQLDLDRSSLFAGDELRGTVHLTLDKAVDEAMVTVQVNGLQRLHWMYIARGAFTPSKHDQWFKHLNSEFYVGELNASLAAGPHDLPFSFSLPSDLISNAPIQDVLRKQVDDYRNVHVTVEYDVVAKLEVAGLSNKQLTQKHIFTIASVPMAEPLGSPVKAETTEEIKALGFGKGGPCTVRMSLGKDVADLTGGLVDVDVEIELPPKRKPHQIKLALCEDVFVDRGSHVQNGTRHVPRDVCTQVFKPKDLTMAEGTESTTLRGTLQLTITDPDAEWYGTNVPSVSSHFLQIRHRIGVECAFLVGHSVTATAPITLVERTPVSTALPV